jgi:ElaB/YqjD/DUF883 family membrane-anchored ribosome-binding protein
MWADPGGSLVNMLTAGGGKLLQGVKAAKGVTSSLSKVNKAIKPSSSGKIFRSGIEAYKNKLALAVDSIIENSENIKYVDENNQAIKAGIPSNLDEFSEAISQTKTKIFNEYSEIVQQAGEEGIKVDLKNIANELKKLANNKVIKILNPQLRTKSSQLAKRFLAQGEFTLQQADDSIKTLNNSLKNFYRTNQPQPGTSMEINALVKNTLSKNIDEALDSFKSANGETYKQLKMRYGALREIEPDVNRQLFNKMKKPSRGIADITDVFTAADIVAGLTGNSPILVTRGIVGQFIKGTTKSMLNPDKKIDKAFKAMLIIKQGK